MPKIPTQIRVPVHHYNHYIESKRYISQKAHVPDSYYSDIFYAIKPDLLLEIEKTIPNDWGALVTGLSGMEFRLVEMGKLESFIREANSDKITFGLGVIVTFGLSLGLSAFQIKHRKLIPYSYHYHLTDEFQGIKEIVEYETSYDFYDDSPYEMIKKPSVIHYP